MTFRPSDDVLEQLSEDAQLSNTLENIGYTEGASSQGERLFFNANEEDQLGNGIQSINSDEINTLDGVEPVEEIKSPDLTDLLKSGDMNGGDCSVENSIEKDEQAEQDFTIDLSEIQSTNSQGQDVIENNQQSIVQDVDDQGQNAQIQDQNTLIQDQNTLIQDENNSIQDVNNQVQNESNLVQDVNNQMQETNNQNVSSKLSDEEVVIDGKMMDKDRINIVSGIEGSIHSNLDLLVDEQWSNAVKFYKKLYRVVFKRGIFIFAAVLGVSAGVFVQAKASQSGKINIINDSLIHNMNFSDEFVLSNLSEGDGMDINIEIPYGFSKINGNEFVTKSNLVSYKGIILPQIASINMKSDNMISLEDFEKGEVNRKDLENLISILVKNDSLNKKIKSFPDLSDYKGQGQTLDGGLIGGFSLGCMFTKKVSNTVCDKFLDIFYKYGKYYNLYSYDADLLKMVKEIKKQNKSVVPVCDMVKGYVLHSNLTPSDVLGSVMNYCDEEDQFYYKKLVGFIDVENSLGQPELASTVFDDPDLNAYKLLSARQNIHKILEGSAINESYIVSYLNFVQNLVNKDRGTHNYLDAIYMDLLYVFNMDELYNKLLKKGMLSSDIKSQIDQINNGNFLLKNESLLSHLTTPNISVSNSQFTGVNVSGKTIEDIFSQYYSMTDRLKIRKVSKVSEDKLRVQAEIFSNDINSVAGETLKATISLYRRDNVLYVEEINIANQPVFSDILNVYVSSSLVTFYAMIGYIDEQVGFWYKKPIENFDKHKSLCEQLREIENILVYNCDDSNILLYYGIGDIEYNFTLENGILQSFTVGDENLDKTIKEKFGKILFNKDNTPTIITSIIDFKLEESEQDDNIEKKLEVIDHFRMHFKIIPTIYDIEGENNIFLVEFVLGDEFTLRGRYNVDTHLLTRISYYECEKTLEIRNLTIEVSAENESQLTEILNNPRIFLTRANQAAFKKYQTMCDGSEKK